MPTFEAMFEVRCVSCNAVLDAGFDEAQKWSAATVSVDPCEDCMESAKEEGREEARAAAEEEPDAGA